MSVLTVAGWLTAVALPPADATDFSLRGKLLLVKPGNLVRVAGAPEGNTQLLAGGGGAVTVTGGSLRVFDLGGFPGGGDDNYVLPGTWKAVGSPRRPLGLRYHGKGSLTDPCPVIVVKRTVVKALCRGGAIRLVPPFDGDVGVILSLDVGGGVRICATFGGRTIKNEVGSLKRVAAPAVPCPDDGAVTTTSTTGPGGSTTTTTATLPPGPHLVINEIDYDQPGEDGREFVEVYNPRPTPTSVAGLALVFVSGATNTEYRRVDLTPGGAIPAGECLVVGPSTVTVPASAVKISVPEFDAGNAIENGAPDGVLLLDTVSGLVLDRFSYEGAITAATVTGVAGPVGLVEGTPLPLVVADNDTITGSLIRDPSGYDSDNAASDWVFTTVPTPGQPNLAF